MLRIRSHPIIPLVYMCGDISHHLLNSLHGICLCSMLFLYAPNWSLLYFQANFRAIFVTIATVKVKLIPNFYTWAIVLIK